MLPQIDVFLDSGYTKEEWKMMAETRKIMHEPDLPLSATCVRVPVFISHSLAVHAEFERPMSADDVRDVLRDGARRRRPGRPVDSALPDAAHAPPAKTRCTSAASARTCPPERHRHVDLLATTSARAPRSTRSRSPRR